MIRARSIRTKIAWAGALLAGWLLCGTAHAADNAPNLEDDVNSIGDATNALGLDLYRALGKGQENLAFSPLSIETALTMTYGGARGQTAEQMARVLHFKLAADRLHPAFGQLLKDLTAPQPSDADQPGSPPSQLAIANALWAQDSYSFQQPFLDLTAKYYSGGLHRVNFSADAEAARRTINTWVEQQTHDKIRDLIPSGAINPQTTRMIVTNAVYFRAPWINTFKPENTREGRFHLARGGSVVTPLMHQEGSFSYLQGEGFQALQMPYAESPVVMTIVLPDRVDGLLAVEKSLSAQQLASWDEKFASVKVRVTLPKFKLTSNFQLAKTLVSLGMADAFNPQTADFSGIASQEAIYISDVVHQAYVDVNEKGTEAAAATGLTFAGSAMAQAPPRVFTVDHPFLFMIRDPASGAILFLGRVNNPKG